MSVENLRCFHDPDCQRHPWHPGHIRKIKQPDARTMYALRQRRKAAGRIAWRIVKDVETQKWGPKIKMTPTQKQALCLFIEVELLPSYR